MDCTECGKRIWFFQRKLRFKKPCAPIEVYHYDCYNKYIDRIVAQKMVTLGLISPIYLDELSRAPIEVQAASWKLLRERDAKET